MSETSETTIERIAKKTNSRRRAIRKDLTKITKYEDDLRKAELSLLAKHSETAEAELFSIPGVGSVRGHFLYHSAFHSIELIANASEEDLASVRRLSKRSAVCIREAARDIVGCDETVAATVAADIGRSRTEITEGYEKLAPFGVTPDAAENSLRDFYSDTNHRSVFDIDGVGLTHGHMLMESGFRTVADIVDAPISALEEARYIGPTRAEKVKEQARQHVKNNGSDLGEISMREEGPEQATEERASATSSTEPKEEMASSRNPDGSRVAVAQEGDSVDSSAHDENADQPPKQDSDWVVSRGPTETRFSGSNQSDISEEESHLDELHGDGIYQGVETRLETNSGVYPAAMVDLDKWLLWRETDDGRKIPRAPWETGNPLTFVNGMDPANWTDFETAKEWRAKLPQEMGLAFGLSRDDDIVFLDLDDVVSSESEISKPAREIIDVSGSYTAVSVSGTGLHVFVRGRLSEDIKAITSTFENGEDGSIEVYDRNRFVALTGEHLAETPTDTTPAETLLTRLEDDLAVVHSTTPDQTVSGPEKDRSELAEMGKTGSIQDVFDAIRQTRPSDIDLKSTQTDVQGDGSISYDPCWTHSESGTRLAALDSIWIYREGMIALDALQVVALEEGIITDEREYPSGKAFWDAVSALRERGGKIPRYESGETHVSGKKRALDPEADPSREQLLRILNRGQPIRSYVHPYDREYYEGVAMDIAPVISQVIDELRLPPAVAYRTAELFVKGQDADIIVGGSNERMLGAAIRIASSEAKTPRPLDFIGESVDENPASIRKKMTRLINETDVSDTITASDLFVDPAEYVPFMGSLLELEDEPSLQSDVIERLEEMRNGSSNPWSSAAGAFYAVLQQSRDHHLTQSQIASRVRVSEVTIRNNYRRYLR